MRTQLVAARSVAEALADLVDEADSAPLGNPIAEVAGPREESLLEAAKLLAAQRGNGLRIEAGEFFEDPEGLYPGRGRPPRPAGQARRPHLRGVAQPAVASLEMSNPRVPVRLMGRGGSEGAPMTEGESRWES